MLDIYEFVFSNLGRIQKNNIESVKFFNNLFKHQVHQIGVRKQYPCQQEINLINVLHDFLEDHQQEVLPYVHVRERFYYPNQNKVVIKFENGQYKNLKPKLLLQSDDLILLREHDMLKLSNARKEIVHLELKVEVSLLFECANCESDFDDLSGNFESNDEV